LNRPVAARKDRASRLAARTLVPGGNSMPDRKLMKRHADGRSYDGASDPKTLQTTTDDARKGR
jgi:hypothetical protein